MSAAALSPPPPELSSTRNTAITWTDTELVAACLDGEERAWAELVDRYGRLVYSIPRRYGLSETDAEDVFQDVFAILHRKLHTVRDADRLSSWLISTTMRHCRRVGRRAIGWQQLPNSVAGSGPTDEERAAWEARHLVRQALRQLGGRCERLLVALFSCPGTPSYEKIGRQLGMKPGSIGPTRARCFVKLAKILADLGLEDPRG